MFFIKKEDTFQDFKNKLLKELEVKIISERCLDFGLDHISNIETPIIIEFGIYTGASLCHISQKKPNSILIGLDSFFGLPEDWRPKYPKETFNLNGGISLSDIPMNTIIIKGWFDETCPRLKKLIGSSKIDLIHIDCDLYTSTKCIFNTFADNIREGTVIVFDELVNYPTYEQHEIKALFEFLQEHPEKGIVPIGVQDFPWYGDQGISKATQQAVIAIF